MKVIAQIDEKQINEMELEISFKMTVREWRELRSVQPTAHPGWRLSRAIEDVLRHVTKSTEARFSDPPATSLEQND